MKFSFLLKINCMGHLWRSEVSKMDAFPVEHDTRLPKADAFVKTDSSQAGASARTMAVGAVLAGCRLSQIAPSVVILNAVNMIHVICLRPFAVDVKPRKPMRWISSSIYLYMAITSAAVMYKSCNHSRLDPVSFNQPRKITRLRIIRQKFAQAILRENVAGSIHEMGRPSGGIRSAIKSLLGGHTPNGLALIPRIAV